MQKEMILERERVRPEKSEVMELICDNTRARTLLGWTPRVSIDEGLDAVIRYITNNEHCYKPDRYGV